MMKKTPMLFCGAMASATLADLKTVTRRLVKPQPSGAWPDRIECAPYNPTRIDRRTGDAYPGSEIFGFADESEGRKFPYGHPGDHIWGRETIFQKGFFECPPDCEPEDACWEGSRIVRYAADGPKPPSSGMFEATWKTLPSIFMPRWASRIDLEIQPDVWVERIRDITPEEVIREGLSSTLRGYDGCVDLTEQFQALWNNLHLKPKPILKKKKIVAYEAYPYALAEFEFQFDFPLISKRNPHIWTGIYRGLPITVYPNPYVWRIPFKRIKS